MRERDLRHLVHAAGGHVRAAPGYPNRCGRVYRLCVTVGSHDPCGGPGLIWGHCDSVEIAVHPPVPNP